MPAETATYDELAQWQTGVVCMLKAGKIAFDDQKENPPNCYFCNRRVADDGSDDHEDECPFRPLDVPP